MKNIESGTIFEKFDIIECLKKDQHSGVFIANHIYLNKKIILKVLKTDSLADKTILERFKREAKILAQLDHPNLIKVFDFGLYESYFYISFEYFASRNLREVIKENNLSESEKLDILVQLLKALNIAHQNNIVHRDIKPENILLDNNHHLKIADFGLALIQTEDALTQDFSIVGTPGYMSPEQLRGEKSLQNDIFSCGILSYELFTGENPFSGETVSETINNILNFKEEQNLFDFEKLPPTVADAVRVMLKKDPRERAHSILEVLNLMGIKGNVYKPVADSTTIKNTSRKIIPATIVIIFIMVAGYLFWGRNVSDNNQSPPEKSSNIILSNPDSLKNKDGNNSAKDTTSRNNIEKTKNKVKSNIVKMGKLFVECEPYADVYIDDKMIDQTPLKHYIEIKTGTHKLKLVHPGFPPYIKNIVISEDKLESVSINFNEIIGYLNCYAIPWGNVYIDNDSLGLTPLTKVPLLNGTYNLVIKYPNYQPYKRKIKILAAKTLDVTFNFDKSGQLIKSNLITE